MSEVYYSFGVGQNMPDDVNQELVPIRVDDGEFKGMVFQVNIACLDELNMRFHYDIVAFPTDNPKFDKELEKSEGMKTRLNNLVSEIMRNYLESQDKNDK